MNPTICFSICGLFYCLLLITILFSKNRKNNGAYKILRGLAIINLCNLFLEAAGLFLAGSYEKYKLLNDIFLRGMLVVYICWFTFFAKYIVKLSKGKKDITKNGNNAFYIMMIVAAALTIFLPMKYVTNDAGIIIYSTGPAVTLVFYYIMFSTIIGLVAMFSNYKSVKISNYSSLFILIVLLAITAVVQNYNPSILLTAFIETFVLYVAYMSIEKNN